MKVKDRLGRKSYAGEVLYFMHFSDGMDFVEDEEGRELPDDASARKEAIAAARDVMAGDLRDGKLDLGSFIEVENGGHELLFKITFADCVAVNCDLGRRKRSR
jgi:hypothetical protein